jgi:hypothetical protein
VQFHTEHESFDHLNKLWGRTWEIHQTFGEWAADRRRRLSDDEIRYGLEMSLVAEDLQTLHGQIHAQAHLEMEFLGHGGSDDE